MSSSANKIVVKQFCRINKSFVDFIIFLSIRQKQKPVRKKESYIRQLVIVINEVGTHLEAKTPQALIKISNLAGVQTLVWPESKL
jgi:hypothetical protein